MSDQELVCEVCGQTFLYRAAEQDVDARAGYPPPRACASCLQQRRGVAAAKRAAKRPRKRRFSR